MGATVLHIIPGFATGGLGACALNMIRGWPDKSVTHQVLSPQFHGQTAEMLGEFTRLVGAENTARVLRHAMFTPPRWAEDVAAVLVPWWRRAGQPTHVIQYNSLDTVYSQFALRRAGYLGRVLVHVGTTLPDVKLTREVFNAPVNSNAVIIPVHAGVARATEKFLKPENARRMTAPIWNATDLDRFDAAPRTKAQVFGFAARMSDAPVDKAWQVLLDAWALASPEIPGGVLRIAGDGRHRAEIEKMVRGPVELLGNLPPEAMPGFYRGLDVFVMASLPIEGFPNVLSEAYAARCFVIGTDVPGVRESLAAGGGAEFLADDAEALAARMVRLQFGATRARNLAAVESIRPRLACEQMARGYYEAGL